MANDVADPLEAVEETDASGDEGSAHEDGSGYSPEEDAGLARGKNLEEAEEDEEDEEVVDGEGLFEGVAGEVLDGGGRAESVVDVEGEDERGGYPEDAGYDGGELGFDLGGGFDCGWGWFAARRGGVAAGEEEFDREESEDVDVKADPVAEGCGALHASMLSRLGG